ncbi:tetratricopeptide repeat protein [Halodesulfovibrio marinisediminis]|uniref:Tetratricopeptide repeat-containing protein n=1 Tax=Halodesulfovibrio marinisediminis DSM 17456 TaxID=1121457 RepID=A0A1N6IV14_9BACT|nr:tetratricopeptide repeat protein [Halodesulfovibrio marinisediminis]SIO35873.1 Tetratricopeptide repeat-containing protein [Halodesulfovibrio marinisediminis DSM 17456]
MTKRFFLLLLTAAFFLSGCSGTVVKPKVSSNPTGVSGKLNPEAELAFAKAHVLWRNGVCENPAKAAGLLREALRLEPEYGEAWLRRGRLLIQFAEYEAAVQDLDKAVRYYPKSISYAYRGYAEFGLGNYLGAKKNYDTALEMDSANGTAWNFLGELLIAQLKVDEGCEALAEGADLGFSAPYDDALSSGVCIN